MVARPVLWSPGDGAMMLRCFSNMLPPWFLEEKTAIITLSRSKCFIRLCPSRRRELLHLLDLETLWALYGNRKEAIEALSSD